MASKRIRVGIIGANVRYGWGSSAHIPALRGLEELVAWTGFFMGGYLPAV